VVALNDKNLRTEADKMQFDVDPMAGESCRGSSPTFMPRRRIWSSGRGKH
jgi:hypothetical protein